MTLFLLVLCIANLLLILVTAILLHALTHEVLELWIWLLDRETKR